MDERCIYCGYDTGHNEVCIAAERDRLRTALTTIWMDVNGPITLAAHAFKSPQGMADALLRVNNIAHKALIQPSAEGSGK